MSGRRDDAGDSGPDDGPRPGTASPGWRQVLLVGAIVVLGVLVAETLSANVAPIGDAFDRYPIAIFVLIGVTAWVLVTLGLGGRGRGRPGG